MSDAQNLKLLPFVFAAFSIYALEKTPTEKPLSESLKALSDSAKKRHPEDRRKIMDKATDDLRKSDIAKKALKAGDKIPSFKLLNADSKEVSSAELLKKGPMIITFFRGEWCPYCNLQLSSLQNKLPELEALGASVVAISPQTPSSSMASVEKNKLSMHVLSDANARVSKKFGLVFKVPTELKNVYKEMGLDLDKFNGNSDWELPIAATYVVNPQGVITYSFVEVDYTKRAETSLLVEEVKKISKKI